MRDSAITEHVQIHRFRVEEQEAAKALILAGMEEHWGVIDPTLNPDLDDIATSYQKGTFLTAWSNNALVGTGALIPENVEALANISAARIVRMSVAKHLRRQGVGRAILKQLYEYAKAAGYAQIVLETTSTWEDAIAFYTRFGFRPIGSWDGDTHFVLDLTED